MLNFISYIHWPRRNVVKFPLLSTWIHCRNHCVLDIIVESLQLNWMIQTVFTVCRNIIAACIKITTEPIHKVFSVVDFKSFSLSVSLNCLLCISSTGRSSILFISCNIPSCLLFNKLDNLEIYKLSGCCKMINDTETFPNVQMLCFLQHV